MADATPEQTDGRGWHYLGVGCVTAVGGFFGGAMLAVMAAKLVGSVTRCAADTDTGAPCNWFVYAVIGGLIGLVLLPSVAILRLRRSRARSDNPEPG